MICVLNSETKPFIPAFEIVKMRPGMKRASSVFLMAWPDRVWFYADCSTIISPDAETLADIARATAPGARDFAHQPRVAFLSFSTRDSAKDDSIDRVKEAVRLVRAGEASGFVSGLNSETKPFLPAFEIVKMREGFKRASSVFVMAFEDRVYFYADCSMNIAPDAETLAVARAYGAVQAVGFEGMHFRTDIGRKGMARLARQSTHARGEEQP